MSPAWEVTSTTVVLGAALELAIERGESVLRDLPGARALDVERVARPELRGGELLGAHP